MSSNPQTPNPNQQQSPQQIVQAHPVFNPQALASQSDVNKYLTIASNAVLAAQNIGMGQPGTTKKQIAMGIIGDALQVTGAVVPGAGPAVQLTQQLIPVLSPLVDSLVSLFKSFKHPAFQK
jgi:hypothetical protein